MKTIFQNDYLTFELNTEKSILLYTWDSKSEELDLDSFLVEATSIVTAILTNKVENVIGNDMEFKFTITPDVQVEMNKIMLAKFNNGNLKKFAHVMSKEFVTQLGVEQLFAENINKTYQDKFFENLQDAINWCRQ